MIQYARYDIHYLIRLRWLMIRDLVRGEFRGGKSATTTAREEDQLLAESLQETIAEMERAEEDVLTGTGNTATIVTPEEKKDALDFLSNEETGGEFGDDTASFITSRQRSRSEDNMFYTPNNSFHNISFQGNDDDDDDKEANSTRSDMSAAQLRLQPMLMLCLSISQERCRDLWSGKSEQHNKNALFFDLTKRSKRGQVNWTPSCEELYGDLVQWREMVAENAECLPGFVVPLDDLVAVAWKRPTTKCSLRRITYDLPPFLRDNEKYVDEMLDIVLRRTLQDEGAASGAVYLYSNLQIDAEQLERAFSLPSNDNWYWDTAVKLFVAGTICAGFVSAILDAERGRRR